MPKDASLKAAAANSCGLLHSHPKCRKMPDQPEVRPAEKSLKNAPAKWMHRCEGRSTEHCALVSTLERHRTFIFGDFGAEREREMICDAQDPPALARRWFSIDSDQR